MSVALLTTQVIAPGEDDWKKLQHLLQYLKCTMPLPLVVIVENLNVIKWWVDESYAAHYDMNGNTGATISLGHGSVLIMTNNQKLNTNISTEANLIGADYDLPKMLSTKYFTEAQGYGIAENITYQDNLSTMMLETNRNKSSTKKTKHIRV